jgi:Raf kinase inhibitor-like YbhB/YbcL family protein
MADISTFGPWAGKEPRLPLPPGSDPLFHVKAGDASGEPSRERRRKIAQPIGYEVIFPPVENLHTEKKLMKLIWTMLAVCAAGTAFAQQPTSPPKAPGRPGIVLTTTAFKDGTIVPPKYTLSVASPISPKLAWTNVPPGTVTFALIMHDPDASPQKSSTDYLHWIIFNIPAATTGLPEAMPTDATLPDGSVQTKVFRGKNTYVGYLGPGAGAAGPYHHYTWELFALDTKLDLGPDASREDVMKAMDGHVLGIGILYGLFHK